MQSNIPINNIIELPYSKIIDIYATFSICRFRMNQLVLNDKINLLKKSTHFYDIDNLISEISKMNACVKLFELIENIIKRITNKQDISLDTDKLKNMLNKHFPAYTIVKNIITIEDIYNLRDNIIRDHDPYIICNYDILFDYYGNIVPIGVANKYYICYDKVFAPVHPNIYEIPTTKKQFDSIFEINVDTKYNGLISLISPDKPYTMSLFFDICNVNTTISINNIPDGSNVLIYNPYVKKNIHTNTIMQNDWNNINNDYYKLSTESYRDLPLKLKKKYNIDDTGKNIFYVDWLFHILKREDYMKLIDDEMYESFITLIKNKSICAT